MWIFFWISCTRTRVCLSWRQVRIFLSIKRWFPPAGPTPSMRSYDVVSVGRPRGFMSVVETETVMQGSQWLINLRRSMELDWAKHSCLPEVRSRGLDYGSWLMNATKAMVIDSYIIIKRLIFMNKRIQINYWTKLIIVLKYAYYSTFCCVFDPFIFTI